MSCPKKEPVINIEFGGLICVGTEHSLPTIAGISSPRMASEFFVGFGEAFPEIVVVHDVASQLEIAQFSEGQIAKHGFFVHLDAISLIWPTTTLGRFLRDKKSAWHLQ